MEDVDELRDDDDGELCTNFSGNDDLGCWEIMVMNNCSPLPPPLNDGNVNIYIGKARHAHSNSTRRRKQQLDMDLIILKLPPFLVGDDGTTTTTINSWKFLW